MTDVATIPTSTAAVSTDTGGGGSTDGGALRVAVIIGSTRRGRAGAAIAAWFAERARRREDLQVDVVDLAETDLPVVLPDFDSEHTPDAVACMSVRLAAADAFVIVTPEYNHSFPASLKNAIDWFYDEWAAKPVAFVSYGGRSQGIRAVEQLRQVFGELQAMTTRDGVGIDLSDVDERGRPASPGVDGAAEVALDQLAWWARALRDARAARPHGP